MKFKLFTISILLTFIFSCKKETVVPTCESPTNDSYFPMTVGSYWIYQWYDVDSSGTEEVRDNDIDTVSVLKDTLIGTSTYTVIKETNTVLSNQDVIYYRRDSLSYLVDPQNRIYFSSTNFLDTLQITNSFTHRVIYKMELNGSSIETPLGIFDCLNFQGEVTSFIPVNWDLQFYNRYYAKGVGKIQETTFYFSAAHFKQLHRRLIEYHIE